jgi:hypothetical protein
MPITNKTQSKVTSIQNKRKTSTPAATQSSLLSFLKKEVPISEAKHEREASKKPELPLTPVTPKTRREKNIQNIDNEPVNNVETINISEITEEPTSGERNLRVC